MQDMTKNRFVYSTDGVTVRDAFSQAAQRGGSPSGHPNDGIVRVSRERAGRRGKTVTLITGVAGNDATRRELASALKRLCGTGGTVVGDVIEIQGDHRQAIAARLTELGHRVKLAGG